MSDTYKPLFNRNYLKIVGWIVAVVIVLLSMMDSRSIDFVRVEKHSSAPIWFSEVEDADYLQIHLLYRTGAVLSNQQQLLQQLLLQELEPPLEAALNTEPFTRLEIRGRLRAEDDRIVLSLTVPARYSGESQALAQAIEGLAERLEDYPYSADLEQRWDRLEARQYLNLNDPEQYLLANFFEQLSRSDTVHPLQRFPDIYRSQISRSGLTVTIQGPGSRSLAELTGNRLPTSYVTEPVSSTNSPDEFWLKPRGNQALMLLGLELPGRQQPDFLAELIAVRVLQQLLQQQQGEFRLQWKSLDKRGYIAMILPGSGYQNQSARQQLMTQLKRQLDDKIIDASRQQLLDRYQQQMVSQDGQLAQLDTIAFYNLPLDYLASFESGLSRIDNARVRGLIENYLDSARQYQIQLPAY